jgi:hypothetical protein
MDLGDVGRFSVSDPQSTCAEGGSVQQFGDARKDAADQTRYVIGLLIV